MYADCAKLTQVVYNILDNAIQVYAGRRPDSREAGSFRRDAIQPLWIMAPAFKEDQPHIFDRFYRVDKARSRDTGGTGLGLSIVNQLVLMHGGTVSVQKR